MKKKNILNPSALLLCIMALLFANTANAQDGMLSVISNGKGAPSEMNFQELKSILRGERQRWSDGTKVVIALMKTNTKAGSTTSKKIYGMTGDELNKYWLALVFQGKAKAPAFFNTIAELQSFVEQTPGAIGIIDVAAQGNTKMVTIDGKKTF